MPPPETFTHELMSGIAHHITGLHKYLACCVEENDTINVQRIVHPNKSEVRMVCRLEIYGDKILMSRPNGIAATVHTTSSQLTFVAELHLSDPDFLDHVTEKVTKCLNGSVV